MILKDVIQIKLNARFDVKDGLSAVKFKYGTCQFNGYAKCVKTSTKAILVLSAMRLKSKYLSVRINYSTIKETKIFYISLRIYTILYEINTPVK